MNLIITGRHIDVSERLKNQLEKKVSKVEKYFHQIIDVQVIVFEEKDDKVIEIIINADGGKFYSAQKGADFFSCIDLLIDRLDQQIKKFKDKQQRHKGPGTNYMPIVNLDAETADSVAVVEASSKPVEYKEAYLEMKLDGASHMLFKKDNVEVDYANRNYALLYQENGSYYMIDVPDEMLESKNFNGSFNKFKFEIKSDSATDPDIDLVEEKVELAHENMSQALGTFEEKKLQMYPFFNTEISAINVLSRTSQGIEIAVPAR